MTRPTLDEILRKYGLKGVHPAADLFPMLSDEDHAELVKDVRKNGFTTPVVVTDDDLLLDGRNRMLASWDAEFDAPIRRFTPSDPLQYVLSENLQRRHLSPSQRAALALKVLAYEEGEAAKRVGGRPIATEQKPEADPPQVSRPWSEKTAGEDMPVQEFRKRQIEELRDRRAPQARDKAAAAVGASGRLVAQAKRVQQHAPDLLPQVEAGTLALDAAEKQVKQRETERRRNQPEPDPPKPATPTNVMLTLRTHEGQEVPYPQPKAKAQFNETNEHISWAAWSWNPVTGCLHGCKYCYARDLATKDSYSNAYPVGFTPLFHHERLDAPANTKVPHSAGFDPRRGRVFVCSMADLYGKWVPDEWIDAVHDSCIANPQWEYLTLTKFPSRYNQVKLPPTAWAGTSVDDQRRVPIAEHAFREITGVKVKWLSLEPLLAPLEFTDLSMFDWVVIGSQTATRQPTGYVAEFAPPFEWVARIVAQAREAGAKVYLKPNLLGSTNPQSPGMVLPQETPDVRAG